MTGDKSKFSFLSLKAKGFVTYGDNNQGRILGIGKVGKSPQTMIDNVLLVKGLKHNLLSISQLSVYTDFWSRQTILFKSVKD